MRPLTGIAAAAVVLLGSASAHAQAVYVEPAPIYQPSPVYVAPAPVIVAPPAYAYTGSVVVNPYNSRTCRIEPDGYRWCWTP